MSKNVLQQCPKIFCNFVQKVLAKNISLGTEFDQKVAEKLEPMKESISEDELDKLKELIYWAAFLEEKDGFRLGVRFTLKLLMEILLPEEQS